MTILLLTAELTLMFSILMITPYMLYYLYVRKSLQRPKMISDASQSAKVSVLICTLNAAEIVEKKVEEILHQDYSLGNVDMIVVDGGSVDGTVETVRRMKERLDSQVNVTVLDGMFRGKASQINAGFEVAQGDFVVTTDVDVRMEPGAIRKLVDLLSTEEVGAVCAREVIINPDQSMITQTEVSYRRFYEFLRIAESAIHSTPIFHGGLSGYRREAVSRIGEDVNADDTQLALSVVRSGLRAVYDPDVTFYTSSSSRFSEGWKQRVRRGQGLQRVFWRNRDMITKPEFGAFGFPILAAELYMHLISPVFFILAAGSFFSFATFLLLSLNIFAIPLVVGIVGLAYWKRKCFPISFVASLTFYQIALFCATLLHLLGYNYVRWTRKR